MRQSRHTPDEDGGPSDLIDLGRLLSALLGRVRMILGVGLLACIAAIAFVLLVTPQFAGQSQVLLESRDSVYTRTLGQGDAQPGLFDEQAVQSQVQIVTSREVAREAIRRLGLVGHPDFDPLAGPLDPVSRIRAMLGLASGAFDGREEDRIFDAYYTALTVYPVPRSRVVAIEFRASDPELAARAANTIAEIYLEQLEAAKGELARAASNWLGANIEDLRERVSRAERAVEDFRARSRLFVGGDNATITAQQLSDLNTRLTEARSAQADAEARAGLIADMIRGGRAFEIPDVANNELIRRLIEQRIDLRSQIALEQRTLLPGHPRILELRAQLADLDGQITSSAERTVRVLENDARMAGSRVEALEVALDAQMRVVAQANDSEVQLRALDREARAEREQLEAYLARYREALARGTENASLPDARIVSRAVAPSAPVYPRKGPTVVLVTLGAMFMAAGFVIVGELAFGGPPGAGRGRRRASDDETALADDDAEPVAPTLRRDGRDGALREAAQDPWPGPSTPAIAAPPVFREAAFDIGAVGARLRGTLDPSPSQEPRFSETSQEGLSASRTVFAREPDVEIESDIEPVAQAAEPPESMLDQAAVAGVVLDRPREEHTASAFDDPEPYSGDPALDDAPDEHPREADASLEDGLSAAFVATASGADEEAYDFDALLGRLATTSRPGRKHRILITGLGDPAKLRDFARSFAQAASGAGRAALVDLQPDSRARASKGLTDLVAGEASFFEVIRRSRGSDLHRIGFGSHDGDVLTRDEDALDIALSALAHTYEWLALSQPDASDRAALALFARRVDTVVLASDRDPSDPQLVDLYGDLVEAGEAQVLVAAVGAVANAVAA